MKTIKVLLCFLLSFNVFATTIDETWLNKTSEFVFKLEQQLIHNSELKLSPRLTLKVESFYRDLLIAKSKSPNNLTKQSERLEHRLLQLLSHNDSRFQTTLDHLQSSRRSSGSQNGILIGKLSVQNDEQPNFQTTDVKLYSMSGQIVSSTHTDAVGRFSFPDTSPGQYLLMASESSGQFITTLYENKPCLGGFGQGCLPQDGTPVTVSANQITEIDFSVTQLAKITGSIKDQNGQHISAYINVHDEQYNTIDSYYVDHIGPFEIAVKQEGDAYLLIHQYGYVSHIYSGIDCYADCDITQGSVVTVSSNQVTDIGEIILSPFPAISGQITNASNNQPINGEDHHNSIAIFNSTHNYIEDFGELDANGIWQTDGTDPREYHVVAQVSGHRTTLYPNQVCSNQSQFECPWQDGTTITHEYHQATENINFQLNEFQYGSISGSVSSDSSVNHYMDVILFGAAGQRLRTERIYGEGDFQFEDLDPGTYYVLAEDDDFSRSMGLPTLYGDQLCFDFTQYNRRCTDVTIGSPIQVNQGQNTPFIDIQMIQGSEISGSVQSATGEFLRGEIEVYILDNSIPGGSYEWYTDLYSSTNTSAYTVSNLVPGQYKLKASIYGYHTEIYNDILCTSENCQQNAGDEITINNLTQHIQNKNFVLDPLPTIQINTPNISESGELQVENLNGDRVKNIYLPSDRDQTDFSIEAGSYRLFFKFSTHAIHPHKYYGGPNCFDEDQCDANDGTVIHINDGEHREFDVLFDQKFKLKTTVNHTNSFGFSNYPTVTVFQNNDPIYTYTSYSSEYKYIPAVGNIKVQAEVIGYFTQIFDGVNCWNDCQLSQGTPINAQLNQFQDIEMNLQPAFEIQGTLRNHLGQIAPNQSIILYRIEGNYISNRGSTTTDAQGRYSFIGELSEGNEYVVAAAETDEYLRTYNGNIVCQDACGTTQLSTFSLIAGQTVNIDITQQLKGRLSIENTAFVNGLVGGGVKVSAYPVGDPSPDASEYTDSSGNITDWSLPLSEFKLLFSHSNVLTAYPNVSCIGMEIYQCLELGQTIEIPQGQSLIISNPQVNSHGILTVQTLDVLLQPITGIQVHLIDPSINTVESGISDQNGEISLPIRGDLAYYVLTQSNYQSYLYSQLLYPDVACYGGIGVGCVLSDGESIQVGLNQLSQITMIQKENPAPQISLIDAFTLDHTEPFLLKVYDHSGNQLSYHQVTSGTPFHIEPGQYYLLAEASGYHPVSWPNHNCPYSTLYQCEDLSLITIEEDTTQIQMTSFKKRGLYFEVINGDDGTPIQGAIVDVWRYGQQVTDSVTMNNLGRGVNQNNLSNGYNYQLSTDIGINNDIYNEVYNNIQCPEGPAAYGLCDIYIGEEIHIDTEATIPQIIRFELNGDPIFDNGFEQN